MVADANQDLVGLFRGWALDYKRRTPPLTNISTIGSRSEDTSYVTLLKLNSMLGRILQDAAQIQL